MTKLMKPDDLRRHIKNFLSSNRYGSLATCMNDIPRSSPVQYFLGQDLETYILSAGGTKFQNISHNPNVCYWSILSILTVPHKGCRYLKRLTSEEEQACSRSSGILPDCHTIDPIKDIIKSFPMKLSI